MMGSIIFYLGKEVQKQKENRRKNGKTGVFPANRIAFCDRVRYDTKVGNKKRRRIPLWNFY
jgi:hypothetical protein